MSANLDDAHRRRNRLCQRSRRALWALHVAQPDGVATTICTGRAVPQQRERFAPVFLLLCGDGLVVLLWSQRIEPRLQPLPVAGKRPQLLEECCTCAAVLER